MNEKQAREAVQFLLARHAEDSHDLRRLHDAVLPWTEDEARRRMDIDPGRNDRRELALARMSQTPFLGLVLDTYGQSLKVDNYFSSASEQASAWQWWQRNQMDARQTGLHRAALQYGVAYALVMPAGDGGARIEVCSPRRMVAAYGEPMLWPGEGEASSMEYPIIAMHIDRHHLRLYDEERVYYFGAESRPEDPSLWADRVYQSESNLPFIEAREHGIGVTPVVRYLDRMMADGEESRGIIHHLLSVADRIDRTNYEQGVAQHFAAFKQRYVIGWMPDSESTALRQKVSDLWYFANKDVKVGQFDETDIERYIQSRQAAVRDFAAVAQVPAQTLGASAISNVSADGLAALETSKDRKAAEIQTSLGEAHEQMLRLCAHVTGDAEGARDFGSEVKWAETSARSFAQTVDGLGKLASLLGVPPEELWADVPGWTRERVERAKKAKDAMGPMLGDGLLSPAAGDDL